MAKRVTVYDCNGNTHTYQSSLLKGFHSVESNDGVCVVEKRLFRQPAVVDCYPSTCGPKRPRVEEKTCGLCTVVNPTQRL